MWYLTSRDVNQSIHHLSPLQAFLEREVDQLYQTKSVFIQSKEAVTRVTKQKSVDMFPSCFLKLGFSGPLSSPMKMSPKQIHDVFMAKIIKMKGHH